MKFTTSILALSLAASSAVAQSVMVPINKAREAAAVSSAKAQESNKLLNAQLQTSATPASGPAKAAPSATKTAAKAPSPSTAPAAKPANVATASASAKPSVVQPEIKKPGPNARDPFISIIRTDKTAGVPCASGKKCLVIGEIVLRGIVRSPSSVIAVVENPQKKTYFLRENDPVFNGNVVKITSDSVVFREQITDRAGRTLSRDITKQLNARPIA